MPFQLKELPGHFARAVFICAVFLLLLYGAQFFSPDTYGIFVYVLFILWLISLGFFAYLSIAQLLRKISEYRYARENNILDSLTGITSYASDEEMNKAFHIQKDDCIFDDGRIVITDEFMADTYDKHLFLINGIIDAESTVHKENGIIKKVTLSIVYLDGERYKMVYYRENETATMRERAEWLAEATSLIASRSVNFRKHLPNRA